MTVEILTFVEALRLTDTGKLIIIRRAMWKAQNQMKLNKSMNDHTPN